MTKTNKLFVYGIFLGEDARQEFGMSNPRYATVQGYVTVGDYIVQAVACESVNGQPAALSGLEVKINPLYWPSLDALEHGYERQIVKTTTGHKVFMYLSKGVTQDDN